MFKLNFSKILPDFSLRKEKTDQFIHTWNVCHDEGLRSTGSAVLL